jgi:hypothetical protein
MPHGRPADTMGSVTIQEPQGPFVLCYDGSEAARHAIEVSPLLVGARRAARVLYVYKPTSGRSAASRASSAAASTRP